MAEELQRLIECPMCLEHFNSSSRWPKLLPCQHTLCLECMDMLNQGNRIQCPQCRQEHTCPGKGPQDLPNNFTMLALLDVQQKNRQSPVTTKDPAPSIPSKSETRPPAINEGVRNSIAMLAKKLQEKSVELSRFDNKEKQTEELFLSVKHKVDTAFELRTRELQTRRDQLIKQLAGARQEELTFLQGQRASAYQYLHKLQTDFSKMRQSLMTTAEPREADLINLLSLCRGYLSQIEQYALNIDQRICSVGFTDPNQQQLSVSIQAYGCLNISTDKAKSVQAVRPVSSVSPGVSVSQTSYSNPFNPLASSSATSSTSPSSLVLTSTASSSSLSSLRDETGSNSGASVSSQAASTTSTPGTPDTHPSQEHRAFVLTQQQTRHNRRLSEPVGMLTGATTSASSLPPLQSSAHPGGSISQPASSGYPSFSQSARPIMVTRHLSMDGVAASLPASIPFMQSIAAGGDQPPPIPRRPGTETLSSISEQRVLERPRSVILRQHTHPHRGDQAQAPPLPPRMNIQIPDTGARSPVPQVSTPPQSTTPQQWVTFNGAGSQSSSSAPKKKTTVIGQHFEKPAGVHVLEKLNNCFAVADEHQHCVMIVNEEGKLLSKMGSIGGGVGQLQFPKAVCANSSGNLIISDWYNHKIQIWDPRGTYLKQFGSRGQSNNQFNGPLGVVCDKQDNIYVCDCNNGCVKVFNQSGEFLRQIGKKGERDGQFRNPGHIAFTQGGELLITDAFKHCVQVFSSQGTYLYRFGNWGTGPGDLNCPGGIAVDAQGYIYVANSGNHRIEVFNPSGSYALFIGRHGSEEGLFDEPLGISVARDGRLLISDSGNKRLQLLWP